MCISKPIEGLISMENRFGLWGFDIKLAPDSEAELAQEPGGGGGWKWHVWKSKTEIEDMVLFLP